MAINPSTHLEEMLRHREQHPSSTVYLPKHIRRYAHQHGLPLDEVRFAKAEQDHYVATLEEMLRYQEQNPNDLSYSPGYIRRYAREHGLPFNEARMAAVEAAQKAAHERVA